MTARPRPLADLPEQQALALADAYTLLDPMPAAVVDDCRSLGALLDTATAGPVVYTVALPAGLPLLNANRTRRMHWAQVRKLAKPIRDAACLIARSQRIPTIDRAHVVYVIHPSPQTRKRDPGNWAESAKAAVDGLVDAGVFVDDDSSHVIGPDPRLGEPVKGGQLVIHITPVDGAR